MLAAQWWPNHGLAALESGVPDIQSAAAGGRGQILEWCQNPKWNGNAPERVPLEFTKIF